MKPKRPKLVRQQTLITSIACTRCKKPINSHSFNVGPNGKPYHEQCYNILYGIRCSICNSFIEGAYLKNFWGDNYCSKHEDTHHKCYCCGRPICDRITKGGYRYSDNRTICSICNKTAVNNMDDAKRILKDIKGQLKKEGLDLGNRDIPVVLVDVFEISKQRFSPKDVKVPGVTRSSWNPNDAVKKLKLNGVFILAGLSRCDFESTLAHELGHVWITFNNITGLPKDVEEGFCNLLAYLILRKKNTKEAKYHIYIMDRSQDLYYGDGYRRMKELWENKGLKLIMIYLISKKNVILENPKVPMFR